MKFLKSALLLLSFCGIIPAATIAAEDISQNDPALHLIHALGCKGCHSIHGEGGSLAPDLTQIGSRLTAGQIQIHLIAPAETRTRGFMPSYSSLPKNELRLISNYLYNLR
jgi:hypothetical protein